MLHTYLYVCYPGKGWRRVSKRQEKSLFERLCSCGNQEETNSLIITEGRHRKLTVNGKTIFNLPGPASSFTDHNSISNIRRDRTRKRSVSVGENAKMIECFVVAKIFKFCHEHGQS